MEIRQTRIVLKARSFDRTRHFYERVLGFPRLSLWEGDDGRRALFDAGTAVVEIRGRARRAEASGRDEAFDYQGPEHKLVLELVVPSAEAAYQELLFRDRNVPGGLRHDESGALLFGTNDPVGLKIVFREEPV
jgi:catechol 2,3-dioxygenase-like lactoylglutathione lyase family enzyme